MELLSGYARTKMHFFYSEEKGSKAKQVDEGCKLDSKTWPWGRRMKETFHSRLQSGVKRCKHFDADNRLIFQLGRSWKRNHKNLVTIADKL